MSCESWFSYRALFVICPDSLFCKLSAILHATKRRRIIMILIRNPVMKKDTPPESQLQLSSISSWKVSGCPRVSESVDNKIHKRVNIGVMLMYAIAFKSIQVVLDTQRIASFMATERCIVGLHVQKSGFIEDY